MTEQEMRTALSYYVELIKQILPAFSYSDKILIKEFNDDVERKLKITKP